MKKQESYRLVISGGGTGGHIFPALAIASSFRKRHPDSEILFVGARNRMEMVKVPQAGFPIIGLWIDGLRRHLSFSWLLFPIKMLISFFRAWEILLSFKPHVVVGTGGYASGPMMLASAIKRIPSLIQEQNSYAGMTNKRLGRYANKICVAYPNMARYFSHEKICFTGNPIREDLHTIKAKRQEGLAYFSLIPTQQVLLVVSGSLGARTINASMIKDIEKLVDANVQVIWQTGQGYYVQVQAKMAQKNTNSVRVYDFLNQVDLAYAVADVVIARAGALTISELCIAEKACILVPSPNVSEDHQKKNACVLTCQNAAIMIDDADAKTMLVDEAIKLLRDRKKMAMLSQNIKNLARPNATKDIINEIEKLVACN